MPGFTRNVASPKRPGTAHCVGVGYNIFRWFSIFPKMAMKPHVPQLDEDNQMNEDQTIQRLFATVDQAADELVALHQALVRIPTVNTGAPDSGNELAACQLLAGRMQAEGIAYEILESAPGRGNLVATRGSRQRAVIAIDVTCGRRAGRGRKSMAASAL